MRRLNYGHKLLPQLVRIYVNQNAICVNSEEPFQYFIYLTLIFKYVMQQIHQRKPLIT